MSDLITPELFNTGDDDPSPVVVYQFEIENQDWLILALLQGLEYLTDPNNWREGGDASIDLATERMTDMLSSLTEVDPMPALPQRWTGWHDEATVVSGNAFVQQHDSSQDYGTLPIQNPPANGDTFTQSAFLRAGSYTLYVLGVTGNNRGRLDWYVDNVLQASGQDWYTAPLVWNVIKTVSITVVGDGYHVLKAVINGKHASSSNYYASPTKFWIKPSTD